MKNCFACILSLFFLCTPGLFAKKHIRDFWKQYVLNVWGTPDQRFVDLLNKYQDFMETYLTPTNHHYVNFYEQTAFLKKMLTECLECVKKYPELAIAVIVVWDEPDSWTFGLCEVHYQTVLPGRPCFTSGLELC